MLHRVGAAQLRATTEREMRRRWSRHRHDPAGNITAITDDGHAAYNRTFGYDDLHRLVTANTGFSLWSTGSFTYDRMGNMLTATLGGNTRTFTYQGTTPLLNTATGLTGSMSYDDAGNETKSPAGDPGVPPVEYSPRNHITSQYVRTYDRCQEEYGMACVQPDIVQEWRSNRYDGRGVRVLSSKIIVDDTISLDPPPTDVYFYTPELSMLNVVAHKTGRTADVIWFGSRPVADHGDTDLRYTYTDHLGTPTLQTTPTATITWRAEYEPFGNVYALRAGTSKDDQPLRFPGQQVFYSTGAGEESYNIFRWYRSGWGRYTQADPLARFVPVWQPAEISAALYGYAGTNPLSYVDPNGLKCCECPEGIWSYKGGSGGFGLLVGLQYQVGTFTCVSKPSLKVGVKTTCVQGGLLLYINAGSFETSAVPVGIIGAEACNAEDLFDPADGMTAGGKFGVGVSGSPKGGTISIGLGVGLAFGGQKCWSTPDKDW